MIQTKLTVEPFFIFLMKDTSILIVSILVPLVFTIGSILIIVLRIRIRFFETKLKIIIYFVQISALALSVAYISTRVINFWQFSRKLFGLYFPIILAMFEFIFSLFRTIPTLFLLSVEIAIIHTEIETTKLPYIIIICCFFVVFHALIYVHYFNVYNKALQVEEAGLQFPLILFYWIYIQIYNWALYLTVTGQLFQLLLTFTAPVFAGLPFFLNSICKAKLTEYRENYYELIIVKFGSSLHIIMCIILAYIRNNRIVSIITPFLTAYVLFIYQIIFFICFIKGPHYYEKIVVDNNDYMINRDNKTAMLM